MIIIRTWRRYDFFQNSFPRSTRIKSTHRRRHTCIQCDAYSTATTARIAERVWSHVSQSLCNDIHYSSEWSSGAVLCFQPRNRTISRVRSEAIIITITVIIVKRRIALTVVLHRLEQILMCVLYSSLIFGLLIAVRLLLQVKLRNGYPHKIGLRGRTCIVM